MSGRLPAVNHQPREATAMSEQAKSILAQMKLPATWCGTQESLTEYLLTHRDLEKLALDRELHRHNLVDESMLQGEIGGPKLLP